MVPSGSGLRKKIESEMRDVSLAQDCRIAAITKPHKRVRSAAAPYRIGASQTGEPA
jgi:hypothetical protein